MCKSNYLPNQNPTVYFSQANFFDGDVNSDNVMPLQAVFKSMLPVSTRNLNGRPSSAPPAPRGGRLASTATHSAPSGAAAAALSSEGTRVAEAEVDERWAGVVLNTNVMQFVGWRALGRFRTVSKVRRVV